MGRVKREIKRIDSNKSRQVTYSKRKNGLVKKAYELSVLCDVEIGLLIFSPVGQLTHFSRNTRIEDLFHRYLNLSDEERGSNRSRPQNTENLINVLNQIRTNDEVALREENNRAMEPETEELLQEQIRLQQQLETAEEQLRDSEPDLSNMTSLEEIESCEKQLKHKLSRATKRKEYLLNNQASTSNSSFIQEMQQQMTSAFDNYVCGVPDYNHDKYVKMNHDSVSGHTCIIRDGPRKFSWQGPRDLTPSMSNSVLRSTNSNLNPQIIKEDQIGHPDDENIITLHQAYTPSDPNLFDMEPPMIENWIEQLDLPCDPENLLPTSSPLDQ